MTKVNRPLGLIAYDNDVNIDRRRQGLDEVYPIIRPRTLVYAGSSPPSASSCSTG